MGARSPYTLSAKRLRLHALDRLSGRLRKVGLDGVLDDLDRTAEPGEVPGEAAGEGFTWDEFDRDDASWWPQGVASARSGQILLVSWYAKRRWLVHTQGSRISVIDRTQPARPRYRHVLLVAPRRPLGLLTTGTVPVHAGGIAVFGDLLYVADTLFGMRVFRLGDLMRVPERPRGAGTARFGAHGYEYVLPQLVSFRVPLRSGVSRLRYSFLSVGQVKGEPYLVVGEYRRKGKAPRLARYPIDPRTGLPALDEHGRCAPIELHECQPSRMQGAALHESTWYVSASAGEGVPGDLYVGAPGNWQRHRKVLPPGPEDLAWSDPGKELWSVSEWPGCRWVFPLDVSRWQRAGHHNGRQRVE
ncbi:MAG: hypothetical protein M3P48_03140 [Actinomycetota bacterium]|nr:hypothetical protein [Actinomycetota bacterium]